MRQNILNRNCKVIWLQESSEETDWSKMQIVGTCETIEKPYLRLTSVSGTIHLFNIIDRYVIN